MPVFVDASGLLSYLRIVRKRLTEHIEGGALLQPDDLEFLRDGVDRRIEDYEDYGTFFQIR